MTNPLYKLKDEYIRNGTSGIKNVDVIFGALELLAREKHIFLELDEITTQESPSTVSVNKGPNSYSFAGLTMRNYIITLSHSRDYFNPAADPFEQYKKVMCCLFDSSFSEDYQYGDGESMEKLWIDWKRKHYKRMDKYVQLRIAKVFYDAWEGHRNPHAQTVNTQFTRP